MAAVVGPCIGKRLQEYPLSRASQCRTELSARVINLAGLTGSVPPHFLSCIPPTQAAPVVIRRGLISRVLRGSGVALRSSARPLCPIAGDRFC